MSADGELVTAQLMRARRASQAWDLIVCAALSRRGMRPSRRHRDGAQVVLDRAGGDFDKALELANREYIPDLAKVYR